MMYGKDGHSLWILYKLVLLVAVSLIFSIIFWATKKWFDMKTPKKRK